MAIPKYPANKTTSKTLPKPQVAKANAVSAGKSGKKMKHPREGRATK